jgi:hypothetical protein
MENKTDTFTVTTGNQTVYNGTSSTNAWSHFELQAALSNGPGTNAYGKTVKLSRNGEVVETWKGKTKAK